MIRQQQWVGARSAHSAVAPNPARIASCCASKKDAPQRVQYGSDWYAQTREAARPRRTVREEIEYRRRANELANNGRERKDLYTDNWDGSEYKGAEFNILTLLAALFFLVPVAGLAAVF